MTHEPNDCPLREAVKTPPPAGRDYAGTTRMRCTECALEFLGHISLTHPMAQGTFYIDGEPE